MTDHPTPLRRYRCQDVAGGRMVLVDQPPPPGVRGGPVYAVVRWDSGAWSCGCGEYRSGSSGGDCRHLRAVRRMGMFGGAGGVVEGAGGA